MTTAAPQIQINLITRKRKPARTKFSFKKFLFSELIIPLLKIIFLPVAIVWCFGLFIYEDVWRPVLNNLKSWSGNNIRNFTWRFALMIESGLPLVQALDILAFTFKGKFAKIIGQIKYEVEGGSTLADAMTKTKTFPAFYVQMIYAGEIGGILDTILFRLNDYYRLKISSKKNIIRFSWIMGIMLSSGVPILDALKIAADTFPRSKKFAKAIMLMRQRISEGRNMADAMVENDSRKYKMFPAIFVQMVGVGENTGSLDQMMTNFAKYSMDNE